MSRRVETLEVTLAALRTAGYLPTWAYSGGGHIKIHASGLPPITVSSTPGDVNAARQASRTVRKIIARNQLTPAR